MTPQIGPTPERWWPEPPPGGMRSALYEGTLRHTRYGPGPVHSFSYRVAMPLLDLAEVDPVCRLHPLVSARTPAPVHYKRSDFLGDPAVPLDQAVGDLVAERTGRRPAGAVALLANLRTWGWLFNPISLYFCATADGTGVEALVSEVQNTPWHERIAYVVGAPGEHRFTKELHVSPFLPMDLEYRLRYSAPGVGLQVVIDVMRAEDRLFRARLDLRRREIDRRALGSLVWSRAAMTHRVSAGIYAQAARLRLKGARFYPHPDVDRSGDGRPSGSERAVVRSGSSR